MKFAHRLFDARWLRAPWARFELTGVVNRIDRRVFHPGTCGEVRFIYRLAYEKETPKGRVASRLPMTVNLVFWQQPEGGDCSAVARRWLAPAGATGDRLARGRSPPRGRCGWRRSRARGSRRWRSTSSRCAGRRR